MVNPFNPRTWEAEEDKISFSSRPAYLYIGFWASQGYLVRSFLKTKFENIDTLSHPRFCQKSSDG